MGRRYTRQSWSSPPVDLCLQLLDCDMLLDGMVKSRLLHGVTDCVFFPHQVSGAVGMALKLYGRIDIDKLLNREDLPQTLRIDKMRAATSQLRDLLVHGCIMSDEVGFGKPKQLLLSEYLHSLLIAQPDLKHGRIVLFKPMLLLVSPTLINQ
jgi:hypothetical protein